MSNIDIDTMIDQLGFPIQQLTIEGNVVYVGTVGKCLMRGLDIVEQSLDWIKIYELNKKKLQKLVSDMYGVDTDSLKIVPQPDRVLDINFKGKEMSLPSVRYRYLSSREWTLERYSSSSGK